MATSLHEYRADEEGTSIISRSSSTTTTSRSSSTTTTKEEKSEEEREHELDMCIDEYTECIGRKPNRVITDQLSFWLGKVDVQVIIAALQATAEAPNPAWAYTKAILMRCHGEGITDLDGWWQREHRWALYRR